MTKNRYDELQQEISTNEKNTNKKSKAKNMKIELENKKDIFQNFEEIRNWINALEENTRKCQSTYKKSTNRGIITKLKETFKNSETLAHNISQSLRKISANLNSVENKTGAEYRMKLVQYSGLVERFKIVVAEHENWAQEISNSEKKFIAKCHQIVNHENLDDYELNQLIEENPHIFTHDYIQNELEAKRELAAIEARHEQLITIEEHLVEIHDMFLNLATLVELQQESLNRVEYFAVQATDHIDNAMDELEKAKKSKKKGRIIKIYILIAVIILIIIILTSIFA